MMRGLFLLFSVLTDHRAVADIMRCDFSFAMFNAGLLCLLGSLQVFRRLRPKPDFASPDKLC